MDMLSVALDLRLRLYSVEGGRLCGRLGAARVGRLHSPGPTPTEVYPNVSFWPWDCELVRF